MNTSNVRLLWKSKIYGETFDSSKSLPIQSTDINAAVFERALNVYIYFRHIDPNEKLKCYVIQPKNILKILHKLKQNYKYVKFASR